MNSMTIGGRPINDTSPCFIIAEAGVNHNGDVRMAEELIDVASEAGADAVKFQTFRASSLVTASAEKAAYQKVTTGSRESQYEMIKRLELTPDDFHRLAAYARRKHILFLSSPFDLESIDLLDECGVPAYKVASGELTNTPLLRAIAAKGKPVILSTGMATLGEIEEALAVLRTSGTDAIALLHCVTSYPAQMDILNLRVIQTLRYAFGIPVGFSDHTVGINASIAARALGACMLEKHFTLDNSLPGPDHRASLEPDELVALIAAIRDVEVALGDGIKQISEAEFTIRNVARKSIVAVVDIPAGNTITPSMIGIKRPGTGIEPKYFDKINGKKARITIRKDEPLSWDMVE